MNRSDHLHLAEIVNLPVSVPAVVYVILVMLFGVLGNGLVLAVYGRTIKKHSNYRSFVLMLAAIDMAQSCLGMPGILVDMVRTFTFYSDTACKLLRMTCHVILTASALTHLLIGIERHRKICKPLQRQISTRAVKIILIVIVIVAFLIALPAFLFYGRCKFSEGVTNVTVSICTISDDYANTPYPAIYESSIFTLLVSTVLALFLIYILIARRIWKARKAIQPFLNKFNNKSPKVNENHASFQRRRTLNEQISDIKLNISKRIENMLYRKSRARSTTSRSKISTSNENDDSRNNTYSSKHNKDCTVGQTRVPAIGIYVTGDKKTARGVLNSQGDADNDISEVFHTWNADCSDARNTSTRSQLNGISTKKTANSKSVKRHSRKVTAVSFAITLVFVLSYVPHFFLTIGAAVNGNRTIHLSYVEEALFRIGGHSYIINSAANPFIYLLMDNDFKEKCKLVIWRCC